MLAGCKGGPFVLLLCVILGRRLGKRNTQRPRNVTTALQSHRPPVTVVRMMVVRTVIKDEGGGRGGRGGRGARGNIGQSHMGSLVEHTARPPLKTQQTQTKRNLLRKGHINYTVAAVAIPLTLVTVVDHMANKRLNLGTESNDL